MDALLTVFANARGYRHEADRARALAGAASGHLRHELQEIATLYDRLADGKADRAASTSAIDRPPNDIAARAFARFRATWPEVSGNPS
jgi:hypothetical protein